MPQPTHNHFPNLIRSLKDEWTTRPAVLQPYRLENDGGGNRYWSVYTEGWARVASWECRPFPGCSALITTTQFQVFEGYREQGIGKALRELQHKSYKRAGFSGEIATVRADNVAMQAFMSGRVIDEFPSDFGGMFKLWLTRFENPRTPIPENHQRPVQQPWTFTYRAPAPATPPLAPTAPPVEANRVEPGKIDWKKRIYDHQTQNGNSR